MDKPAFITLNRLFSSEEILKEKVFFGRDSMAEIRRDEFGLVLVKSSQDVRSVA